MNSLHIRNNFATSFLTSNKLVNLRVYYKKEIYQHEKFKKMTQKRVWFPKWSYCPLGAVI